MTNRPNRIALFATCVTSMMRPQTTEAARSVLDRAGFDVTIPKKQTCCSQIAFNAGDRVGARKTLEYTISCFGDCDAIVLPSGSCAAMFARHTSELINQDETIYAEAMSFANRCYEFSDFLTRFTTPTDHAELFASSRRAQTASKVKLGYHHSCTGLRELGIYQQPRDLLAARGDLTIVDLDESFRCCGFGGLFAVKHPLISAGMADKLIARIKAMEVQDICGGDWGCLLHLSGRLSRAKVEVRTHHYIDVLAYGLEGAP